MINAQRGGSSCSTPPRLPRPAHAPPLDTGVPARLRVRPARHTHSPSHTAHCGQSQLSAPRTHCAIITATQHRLSTAIPLNALSNHDPIPSHTANHSNFLFALCAIITTPTSYTSANHGHFCFKPIRATPVSHTLSNHYPSHTAHCSITTTMLQTQTKHHSRCIFHSPLHSPCLFSLLSAITIAVSLQPTVATKHAFYMLMNEQRSKNINDCLERHCHKDPLQKHRPGIPPKNKARMTVKNFKERKTQRLVGKNSLEGRQIKRGLTIGRQHFLHWPPWFQ